jgi:hypothetical protein
LYICDTLSLKALPSVTSKPWLPQETPNIVAKQKTGKYKTKDLKASLIILPLRKRRLLRLGFSASLMPDQPE